MIGRALRKVVRSLTSARLATLLLAFLGVWSTLASLVPQGAAGDPKVAAWASAHPIAESVARAVGLHKAFSSPVFALCVSVLAVSTALCAWRRTKVALAKGRMLQTALAIDARAPGPGGNDLEIAIGTALEETEVLAIAAETLGRLGMRPKRAGVAVTDVSPVWSVWGSPVFHGALLALIVIMLLGNMLRSSGQMGLAVGQAKVDEPRSYGILSVGPLHAWPDPQRSIRVDAFEVNYKTGGVDRGPTPTVSVLDEQGAVIRSQRVYPNRTLKTGSLTIYPADYGLAATVSVVDTAGASSGLSTQLMDFAGTAEGGTAPVGYLRVGDPEGNERLKVFISVPLDRTKGGFTARLPKDVRARVVAVSLDDEPVLDRVLRPGEELSLPVGGTLRLLDVGYYARLQLVDDPSVLFLYVGLVVATIGLGVATLARQQAVVATVVDTPAGARLSVRMSLWRNVLSSRSEIERELTRALGGTEEETTT